VLIRLWAPLYGSVLAKFRVKDVKPGKDGKPSEVKLKMRLNPNGILTVESAQQIEELEAEATADAAPAPAASAEAETPAAADGADAAAAAAAAEEKKRRVKRLDLAVETSTSALPASVLQAFRESEAAMVASDKLIADTLEKKNQLEEFVYDVRSKLEGAYGSFIDPAIKEGYLAQLAATETWLYDEGESATKSAFVERLTELQKVSQPVVDRFNESEARPKAIADLELTLKQIRDAAQSWDEKYAHIEPADKARIVDEVVKKESWLATQKQAQSQLKPHQPAAVRAAQIAAERTAVQTFANGILNKPKPAPPAATPPPPAAAATPPPPPPADSAPAPDATKSVDPMHVD
jgi:heat shock 70kDa protein 4